MAENKREEIDDVANIATSSTHEKNIVNVMMKDIAKQFNEETIFWTNQQVTGTREMFIGVVVNIWVALPLEN